MKSGIDFASGWKLALVVILVVQSGNCFQRFSKNSDEDDRNTGNTGRRPSSSSSSASGNTVPAQSSLLPGSSPSLVNLIYTWLHPGVVTHHNPWNPAGFPFSHGGAMVGSHGPSKGHNNGGSSDESGIPWEQSINNRPQGGFGGVQQFHPHFGQAYKWPWSSDIKKAGRDWYTVQRGQEFNKTFAIYYWSESGPISPFHDIPLFANEGNKIFNMVVEVSRWSNAKLEIATKEPLNPIKQDTKKGKLRYVANVFPHHGYMWNYGALPQTWENPQHIDESTGERGDNDPIDVCEIGYRVARPGEVLQVKVLGVIGLVDEGETDWKLIAIDVNDPLAPQLSDITDVEQHLPGYLKATVEWFKLYKVPDGKPENQFAFNGEAKDRDFAHQIILGTHVEWRDLVSGKSDGGELHIGAVTVPYAAAPLTVDQANKVIEGAPVFVEAQPLDPKVDQWHFVNPK